jgi:predicted TPR repeat methyltransferase
LIYIGECEELFSLICKISKEGSRFILSTEKQAPYGYTLAGSGRFKHSNEYLIKCAAHNGFVLKALQETSVRASPSGSILGDLIIFEKREIT